MRIVLMPILSLLLLTGSLVVLPSIHAEEITVDELISRYEATFTKLQSWDVTFATGPISLWDDWAPKHPQRLRWRKFGEFERKDVHEHFSLIPVFQKEGQETELKSPTKILISPQAEYTDGSKLWRFSGDPQNAKNLVDIIDQKGFHAEIRPVLKENILWGFPYSSFNFSLLIGDRAYLISQILREFRTEIISSQTIDDRTLITTRSYYPSSDDENTKNFVQISFDSSIGYSPRQIIFPVNFGAQDVNVPIDYSVRNFVDYHSSENGAFFPVKIELCVTKNIEDLENPTMMGKLAVLDIKLNEPVEVPEIEFPPGVVVTVEESGNFKNYLWGEDNKPTKLLTTEDYEAAKKKYEKRQKATPALPSHSISPWRIAGMIFGAILVLWGIRLSLKEKRKP